MHMKHLKHLRHTLATCAFSTTFSCCWGELRLVDAELDAGTKLDAMEVASAELIGGADLGSARRAQRRCMDVGGAELAGNTRVSGGSALELIGNMGLAWSSAPPVTPPTS